MRVSVVIPCRNAENTVAEYWAEGTQWWFESNFAWTTPEGVEIYTADSLKGYDAKLYDTELMRVTGAPAGTPVRFATLDYYDGGVWGAGSRAPWRLGQSYARDVVTLRHGKIDDGSMRFGRAVTPSVR